MANSISELPEAQLPLSGEEKVYIEVNGVACQTPTSSMFGRQGGQGNPGSTGPAGPINNKAHAALRLSALGTLPYTISHWADTPDDGYLNYTTAMQVTVTGTGTLSVTVSSFTSGGTPVQNRVDTVVLTALNFSAGTPHGLIVKAGGYMNLVISKTTANDGEVLIYTDLNANS